jgi:lysophospholipase L1-like esterase
VPLGASLVALLLASTAQAPPAGGPAAAFALRDGDRVVFYGDSITEEGGYGRLVEEYVRTRFPGWDVRFYNAGVGGDTVRGGWAGPAQTRLQRDVVALRPTVVTVMLGMNDGGYKAFDPAALAAFAEGYRSIAQKLRAALPAARLVFVRPSPFDDVSRPPLWKPGYDDTLRRLGCYVVTLGAREGATVVDFREPLNAGLAAVAKDDPALARMLVPDRVHPGPAGHLVMGAALLRAWGAPSLVTRVEIDAAAGQARVAENTELTGLQASGDGLAWTQLDRSLPLPVSFEDADVDLAQRAGADLEGLGRQPLVVTGLAAGRFELRIDGRAVGTFDAAELASGVNLARLDTPMRQQAYPVKWSVAGGLEAQRVRRHLLVAAAGDPSLLPAAETLAARDEASQKQRAEDARPRPRRYELVRLPAPAAAP